MFSSRLIATIVLINMKVYFEMNFFFNTASLAILWLFICIKCIRIASFLGEEKCHNKLELLIMRE